MRSLPIAYELAGNSSENRRLEPIVITAQAPFCWGQFGFDKIAERTREQLKHIPINRLRRIAAREFAKRFHSETAKNPERSANIYLRETIERVQEITERSPLSIGELNNKKKRRAKAEQLATIVNQLCIVDFDENTTVEDAEQLVFACYIKAHDFVLSQGAKPPYQAAFNNAKSIFADGLWQPCNTDALANKLERGIRRMTCDKWWLRKLDRMRDVALEHLNITMGQVNKFVSPYASKDAVAEFKGNKRRQREWVDSMALENESGHEVKLSEIFKGSVSNPEIRRIELMVRIRGYEEWATEHGLKAIFYTVTAPSKYHANSEKYNNATPRETQDYLVKQWAKVRSTLDKDDIKLFGLRVAEPHADATPHWHMLLFVKPSEEKQITATIKHFALQHDSDEKGAQKNRFDCEVIDPSKGSAVGYIAKYISKNINASHIEGEIDHETGQEFIREQIKTEAEQKAEANEAEQKPRAQEHWAAVNVAAWASRWRIRQFQFVGGAPVGVWRELRRIKPEQAEKLADDVKKIRDAADNSRFAEFIALLGGAFAKRGEHKLQIAKDEDGANDYGEVKKRVVGIATASCTYVTRSIRWALKKRGSASPWSTGNNCHQIKNDWQVKHGDKLDPFIFIPQELRDLVKRGAKYLEIDDLGQTATEYKTVNGYLVERNLSFCH